MTHDAVDGHVVDPSRENNAANDDGLDGDGGELKVLVHMVAHDGPALDVGRFAEPPVRDDAGVAVRMVAIKTPQRRTQLRRARRAYSRRERLPQEGSSRRTHRESNDGGGERPTAVLQVHYKAGAPAAAAEIRQPPMAELQFPDNQ